MEIEITYSEAYEQHPEVVQRWVDDAKHDGIDFSEADVTWAYSFGVIVFGVNGEVFEKNTGEKTPRQISDRILKNVAGLSLVVECEDFKRKEKIEGLTKLFIKTYRNIIEDVEKKRMEDREKFDNLSPEEKSLLEEEMLNEMFGGEGFLEISDIDDADSLLVLKKKTQYNIDDLLDKVSSVGLESLSEPERKFLDEHSKK